jgi:hypothetical protein
MAKAPALLPGYQYRILPNGGDLAGELVTILDNVTFPDNDPRRRKVTVDHDGETIYLLPRVIADLPEVMAPTVAVEPLAPLQQAVTTAFTIPVAVNTVTTPVMSSFKGLSEITDPMDPRLDHLRPKRRKVLKYKTRTMANGMTDIEFFLQFTSDAMRKSNEMRPVNVCLRGDTQSGKTFLVEALAWAWSDLLAQGQRDRGETVTFLKAMPIFTLSGSAGITDYDLFGQTTNYTDPATGERNLVWLSGVVDLAARCGGILYLDEMNFMGTRVTSSLHSVIDHRHSFTNRNKAVWMENANGTGIHMPETVDTALDLWVIATINEGYQGVGEMNEAYAGRFRNILWGYHDEVERDLVKSPSIRLFAEALRTARAGRKLQTPVGTAHLEAFKLDLDVFGQEMAFANFLGMFKPNERKGVSDIYTVRGYQKMIEDEVKQAAINDALNAQGTTTQVI